MAKTKEIKKSLFNAAQVKFIQLFVSKYNIEFDPAVNVDEIKGYEMKLGKDIKYSFEDKMCRVILNFEFISSSEVEDSLKAKASLSIENHFLIENMDDICVQKDTGITIDVTLPAHLVAMAYSTSRGLIYERFQSTPFRGLLLPVIDPYKEMEN